MWRGYEAELSNLNAINIDQENLCRQIFCFILIMTFTETDKSIIVCAYKNLIPRI